MYSVSIPLGSTVNMDGAVITITIMTLATAHTFGVEVSFPTALLLSFLFDYLKIVGYTAQKPLPDNPAAAFD